MQELGLFDVFSYGIVFGLGFCISKAFITFVNAQIINYLFMRGIDNDDINNLFGNDD